MTGKEDLGLVIHSLSSFLCGGWEEGRAWVLTVTKELKTVTACFVFRGGVARVAL